MFENIIGHVNTVLRLQEEIQKGILPASMLYYGEPYTGKLTTALEAARALTCEKYSAEWNCECKACKMQRLLIHPATLLLGSRYFQQEIAACSDVLRRQKKLFAQYLFTRAVRKLLRRFDPILWEGNEPKLKGIQPHVQNTMDNLEAVLPGRDLPGDDELEKILGKISESCKKIIGAVDADNIPISQIRKTTFWAHTSLSSENRVVIIENADRMLDGSRNALLKILEEPPRGVYFILITSRRGMIIPTVLSRLRPYHFGERLRDDSYEVLTKIFREDSGEYETLSDYFLAWDDINTGLLHKAAKTFWEGILNRKSDPNASKHCEGIISLIGDNKKYTIPFLKELLKLVSHNMWKKEKLTHMETLGLDQYEKWNRMIQNCSAKIDLLNQNPALIIESLYYSMKDVFTGRI
ncbi:MAG: hypothetical protein AB1798_10085 [Spirochaetota bacterium]